MPHVLWTGPSQLDGSPIELLAPIGTSTNRKTGTMLQTYILRADMSPLEAVLQNMDDAICGDCPHRGDGMKGRSCYVNIGQGAMAVWKGARGFTFGFPDLVAFGHSRMVRVGSYGDPAAVPVEIWLNILRHATGNTGYTHQWRTCDPRFKEFCMASVDSLSEMLEAQRAGWRTFRVLPETGELASKEVICPNEATGIQCIQCGHCDGSVKARSSSVVIHVHGTAAARNNFHAKAA